MPDIAFVMDPLDTLALKKDSTLAMIRAAQMRGWAVTYLLPGDLYYQRHEPMALCQSLELLSPFVDGLDPATAQEVPWYTLGPVERRSLNEFDVIMMRKDPPFDMDYIYATYLLERAEDTGVLVVNKPASLRDCNEKFYATRFPDCCPELIVSSNEGLLREFQQDHGNVVFKKLDGMGGMSVFRVMDGDPNIGVILETLTSGGREQIMAQVFLPEIEAGDKRILIVDGTPVDYALARVPKAGEARGNLAAGGTGIGQPLSDRDRWIAEQVAPDAAARGLMFVGIDVIGNYLTEVNVTCPTCIRELDTQFSLDISGMLFDAIDRRLSQR